MKEEKNTAGLFYMECLLLMFKQFWRLLQTDLLLSCLNSLHLESEAFTDPVTSRPVRPPKEPYLPLKFVSAVLEELCDKLNHLVQNKKTEEQMT